MCLNDEFFLIFHKSIITINALTRSQASAQPSHFNSTRSPATAAGCTEFNQFINNVPSSAALSTATTSATHARPNLSSQSFCSDEQPNHTVVNAIPTNSNLIDASSIENDVSKLELSNNSGQSISNQLGLPIPKTTQSLPIIPVQPNLSANTHHFTAAANPDDFQFSISPAHTAAAAASPAVISPAQQQPIIPPLNTFIQDQTLPLRPLDSPDVVPSVESEGVKPDVEPEPPPITRTYKTIGTASGYAKGGLPASILKLASVVRNLHLSLGCIPYRQLADMITQGKLVHDILTGKIVMYLADNIIGKCDYCSAGKAKQPPQPHSKYDSAIQQLAHEIRNISMDLMFTKSEHRRHHPVLVTVLELHNFVNLIYLNSKSTKEVQAGLDRMLVFYEKYGHAIDNIRCDREASFVELSKSSYKIDLTGGP